MPTITTPDDLIRPTVQLSGEDGNAFFIIGRCAKALRRAGNPKETVDSFREQAMSGDYDRVLQVAMAFCEVE